MRIMLETTNWADGQDFNHIYVFNDSMSQAIAYVPLGTEPLQKFRKPLRIDTRGRTFVELEDSRPTKVDQGVVVVEGSKGEKYYVSNESNGWVCTCPGFKFRGACKHVKEQEEKV